MLNAYVDALTRADPDALVSLLRADVEMEMPPIPTWFTGQRAVLGFLATRVLPKPIPGWTVGWWGRRAGRARSPRRGGGR